MHVTEPQKANFYPTHLSLEINTFILLPNNTLILFLYPHPLRFGVKWHLGWSAPPVKPLTYFSGSIPSLNPAAPLNLGPDLCFQWLGYARLSPHDQSPISGRLRGDPATIRSWVKWTPVRAWGGMGHFLCGGTLPLSWHIFHVFHDKGSHVHYRKKWSKSNRIKKIKPPVFPSHRESIYAPI